MTGADVKKMRDEEITEELGRLRAKLYDLRTQTVTEKVENLSQFGTIRRDVARLLTERNSRRRAKGGSAPARGRGAKKAAKA